MARKAIKRKASELLGYGLPKQQAFDLLMAEFPDAKPKKVAEALRYMPTLHVRERYGKLHLLLLAVILAHALLRLLPTLLNVEVDFANTYRLIGLVPLATLLLGWSIYRWQGEVMMWVGWANVAALGTVVSKSHVFARGEADALYIASIALPVLVGVLALLLVYLAFPGYKVEKDPMGGPVRVVFREEGLA
ncbi:MAG: hypothetical protein KIT10_14765 [Flavobacteriales bacterium]|nr:hypothetical protein [Flavobacteriales bacterium]